MDKIGVTDFDQSVCRGDHPAVDGPCQHLAVAGEDTDESLVGRLSDLENKAIEAVTGEQQFACGMCQCPLTNLELFELAPEECPRIAEHGGQKGGP